MDAEDTTQDEAGATASSLSMNATAFCIASLIGAGDCDDGPPPPPPTTTTEQDTSISDSEDDDGNESKMTSEVSYSNSDHHGPGNFDPLILLLYR